MTKSTVEGIEKVNRALDNVPRGALKSFVKVIDKSARLMQTHVREEHLTGGTTETRLRTRSGRLKGSVIPLQTEVKGDSVDGGIAIGTVYARTHFGPRGQSTVITPKKGKYLTIPLPAAMTRAGVLKGGARESVYGDTFVARSRAGNLIVFGRQRITKGKNAGRLRSQIVPLFLLKKSVVIHARIHPEDILGWIIPRLMSDLKVRGLEVK